MDDDPADPADPAANAPASTNSAFSYADTEAGINEPDQVLSLWGVIKRGWFLVKFQGGKQLLVAFAGGLPLSALFAFMMSVQLLLDEAYENLWLIALVLFDVVYVCYLPSILGAIICLTSAAYHGEEIGVVRAYRRTWAHYWTMLLAIFGVYFGTLLGLYMLILPGIWFLSKYGLAWIIVPIEKCDVHDAFRRSNILLGKPGRRKVFLLIQLMFVLVIAISLGLVVVFIIFLSEMVAYSFAAKFFVCFIAFEVSVIVITPYIPMMTAFYFDAVKRSRQQPVAAAQASGTP